MNINFKLTKTYIIGFFAIFIGSLIGAIIGSYFEWRDPITLDYKFLIGLLYNNFIFIGKFFLFYKLYQFFIRTKLAQKKDRS
jgi:ABC-type dipeptide/oligopeptide/nickel transport system permease subunit